VKFANGGKKNRETNLTNPERCEGKAELLAAGKLLHSAYPGEKRGRTGEREGRKEKDQKIRHSGPGCLPKRKGREIDKGGKKGNAVLLMQRGQIISI